VLLAAATAQVSANARLMQRERTGREACCGRVARGMVVLHGMLAVFAAVAVAQIPTYTMSMRTRVTLTTDFGTRDSYVAQLKGVLYAEGPNSLELVDLTHEIDPQNLREAALFVRAAWPRFPRGTIHLVVVDPGVGSARRALAIEHAGQHWLGPDNGVMSWLLAELGGEPRAVAIEPERFGIAHVSATFHGRDVFAPAAARLARGTPLAGLGAPASELVQLAWPNPCRVAGGVRGEIIHIDRFGNLISNVSAGELAALSGALRVRLGDADALPIVHCYADAERGAALALIGSSNLLEIAVRDASARERLGAQLGDSVSVEC
jgi:S-adenosylmethionine hydrolase